MLAMLSLVGNLLYFILLAAAIQLVGIAPASLIVGVLPVTITLLGLKTKGPVAASAGLAAGHGAGRYYLHQYRYLCRSRANDASPRSGTGRTGHWVRWPAGAGLPPAMRAICASGLL
jgi:hypothetical protein